MNFVNEIAWGIYEVKDKREYTSEIKTPEKRITDIQADKQLVFTETQNEGQKVSHGSFFNIQLRPDIFKKLVPSLLLISVITMIFTAGYEYVKQTIAPALSLWESHVITILFTGVIAPIGAYLALRKVEILRQNGIKEIEERKKVEIELRQTQEELETKVKERTEALMKSNMLLNLEIKEKLETEAELIKAKEKAEKSDQLKSEFLAQISHEIRTPINAILSFSSLIQEEISDKLEADLKSGFLVISSAGKRMIRTIDLILNMSELQTGTFEYLPQKIDLCEDALETIYAEYKQQAVLKDLQFSLIKQIDFPLVYADEHTVQQIFSHLVDNAIKFTHSGEIKIIVDENEEKNIVVHVCDTGIGISKEYMNEIFKPFMQENNGYTREYEGNGLGLALVKKYCDLNKAKILIDSEKGIGSTFSIVFNK